MPSANAPSPLRSDRSNAREALITTCRLGVVSFLNSRPLLEGLAAPSWTLHPAVPAALAKMLASGEVDVALLPVVDFARREADWELISDGCIGCDGETMTVRVFAKAPPDRITRLIADTDSHTSVILAQVIWRELFNRQLEVAPRHDRGAESRAESDALLLIGDKVVTQRPRGFGFEVDLGAAWKHLTGLPMVFAAWTTARGRWSAGQAAEIAVRLAEARDRGVACAAEIAAREATSHGWPVELAAHYLTAALRFTLNGAMRAGLERFVDIARRHSLL